MRPALFALAMIAACGPKVSPRSAAFDEDLGGKPQAAEADPATTPAAAPVRALAPSGKGLRTGTIARDRLVAVLDAGPGNFLRQMEITASLNGGRFVGWQLVQILERQGPLVDVDVAPGDILLAINGQPLSRPDQLQTVWDSLRTANHVTAQLWRGQTQFALEFAIEPQVAAQTPATPSVPVQLK